MAFEHIIYKIPDVIFFRGGQVGGVGGVIQKKIPCEGGSCGKNERFLVWTEGLTVEKKLRFQIPLSSCSSLVLDAVIYALVRSVVETA